MDKDLIKRWNSVVGDTDKVFMLGDFAFKGADYCRLIGNQLKGKKTLVMGNHDRHPAKVYYESGFDYVSQYPIIFEDFFILSHEPQYMMKNGVYVNIFGHVHDNPEYTDYSDVSYCVSVERINYTPISFDDIKKKVKTFRVGDGNMETGE